MLAGIVEAAHIQEEPAGPVGDLEIRPADGLVPRRREGAHPLACASSSCSSRSRGARTGSSRGEDLYQLVWGGQLRDGDRSIDVYVHKLRVKLETALPGLALHPHPCRASDIGSIPSLHILFTRRYSGVTGSASCPATFARMTTNPRE